MGIVRIGWRGALSLGGFVGAAGLGLASVAFAGAGDGAQVQLGTTTEDFFQPGSQPLEDGMEPFVTALSNCINCHADYGNPPEGSPPPDPIVDPPYNGWVTSMMAQAARDPVWHAALTIANQDANDAGEYCIRCHAPGAWLQGRSLPADTSGFIQTFSINDFDGVQCHFCHRRVNAVLEPDSPPEDVDILANLDFPPPAGQFGNGRYVVDPADVRRGPLPAPGSVDPNAVPLNLHFGSMGEIPIIESPLHTRSALCSSCHDVSNPVLSLQPDGTYDLNANDAQHPTQNPYDMFPEQRTFSEWANSQYAAGGVYLPDRYDPNHPTGVMENCQDCHMPTIYTGACFAWENEPFFPRLDMPRHFFNGANHWVLRAIRGNVPDSESGLSEGTVDAAIARTAVMLDDGADLGAVQLGPELKVRVTNWSGHKLPTGYPEGRRLWVNVRFYDGGGALLEERGAYDPGTAELTPDTKVYEAIHGMSADLAAQVNLPAGASSHLVLNNVVLQDNRIPPVGFTNAAFDAINAAPVGAVYADGQHWDDTLFAIPPGAASAEIRLRYQSMTKDYVEFLRDTNITNTAGDDLHALWDDAGGTFGTDKAAPVEVECVILPLAPPLLGDVNGDGNVGFADILAVIGAWGPCPPPELCPADVNCNGTVGFDDILIVIANWG